MRKFVLTLVMLASSLQAFADIQIVQSQIIGKAFKTVPNLVTIESPQMMIRDVTKSLSCGRTTAVAACTMLNLEYSGYICGTGKTNAVYMSNAVVGFADDYTITTLSCVTK